MASKFKLGKRHALNNMPKFNHREGKPYDDDKQGQNESYLKGYEAGLVERQAPKESATKPIDIVPMLENLAKEVDRIQWWLCVYFGILIGLTVAQGGMR